MMWKNAMMRFVDRRRVVQIDGSINQLIDRTSPLGLLNQRISYRLLLCAMCVRARYSQPHQQEQKNARPRSSSGGVLRRLLRSKLLADTTRIRSRGSPCALKERRSIDLGLGAPHAQATAGGLVKARRKCPRVCECVGCMHSFLASPATRSQRSSRRTSLATALNQRLDAMTHARCCHVTHKHTRPILAYPKKSKGLHVA